MTDGRQKKFGSMSRNDVVQYLLLVPESLPVALLVSTALMQCTIRTQKLDLYWILTNSAVEVTVHLSHSKKNGESQLRTVRKKDLIACSNASSKDIIHTSDIVYK